MNLMDFIIDASMICWVIGPGALLVMMAQGKRKIRPKVVR